MLSLMVAMALAPNAQAAEPPRTSGWQLRADPAICVLERRNGALPDTLSIRTTPGSDEYQVAITSPAIKKLASLAPASLTFAPTQKTLNGRARVVKLEDETRAIWMESVAPSLLDAVSGADTATMARSDERVSVQIPGSAKAVEALRRCNADQLIAWGADAAQFAPGGTMPVAVKARDEWLSRSELLKVMGQARRSDLDEVFRVGVSADGVADDCHSLNAGLDKGVEKAACAAVANKRLFTPARDANGHSVRGVATFRILLASRPY